MRSGSRSSPEGTRFLFFFAGDAVSPMLCPADGQWKDDKKGGKEERQAKKRAETERQKKP